MGTVLLLVGAINRAATKCAVSEFGTQLNGIKAYSMVAYLSTGAGFYPSDAVYPS
jgi:hypothetical protein